MSPSVVCAMRNRPTTEWCLQLTCASCKRAFYQPLAALQRDQQIPSCPVCRDRPGLSFSGKLLPPLQHTAKLRKIDKALRTLDTLANSHHASSKSAESTQVLADVAEARTALDALSISLIGMSP